MDLIKDSRFYSSHTMCVSLDVILVLCKMITRTFDTYHVKYAVTFHEIHDFCIYNIYYPNI